MRRLPCVCTVFPIPHYGWRTVAPLLADAGWRVVAPFMRGYAPSSIASDGSYHVGALMDDALRVLDAAGPTGRDVVIGHDWGAMAASGLAAMPDSPFAKAVIMSVPPVAALQPIGVGVRRSLAALLPRQAILQLVHACTSNCLGCLTFRVLGGAAALATLVAGLRRDRGSRACRRRDRITGELARGAGLLPRRRSGRGSTPPRQYADLHRHWRPRRGCRRCTCTATTTDAWHRYIRPGPATLPAGSRLRIVENAGHFLQLEQPDAVAGTSSTSSGESDRCHDAAPACRCRCAVVLDVGEDAKRRPSSVRVRRSARRSRAGHRSHSWPGRGVRRIPRPHSDGGTLTYPSWVSGPVGAGQFTVHELDDNSWAGCLAAVGGLADEQLDARLWPWRLVVFTPVEGVPGVSGPATVAVVQMSHAFADGVRSSALAGRLFGRADEIAPVTTPRLRGVLLPWRGLVAARAHRQLVRDTEAGLVPPQAPSRPALRTNAPPAGTRSVRTLIRHRGLLAGPTVTVGVLCAVSTALSEHLRAMGDDPSTLGAEVPMAKTAAREANNHYGNVGVGLYPELGIDAARDADRRRPGRPSSSGRTPRDARRQSCVRGRCPRRFCAGAWHVRSDRSLARRDRQHRRLQRQQGTGGSALRRCTRSRSPPVIRRCRR